MKTYTFFYYNSYKADKADVKKYVIDSPRFDSAFSSFAHFLSFHESGYIDFMYTYTVFNGFKNQTRGFTYNNILYLVSIKDKHNASFWETFDEKQIH